MKYIFRYGFTLIEAIIVITILVILALISFLALQGYTSSARDSTRISDLKAMRKSFDMYIPYHGSLPFPDDALSVRICSYSGCLIGKEIGMQWPLERSILTRIGFQGNSVDPFDKTSYTLLASRNGRVYELMAFLENPDGIMEGESGPNVSDGAVFANRYPYLFGNRLGVLISASSATYNAPIQLLLSWSVDLSSLTGVVAIISNEPRDLVASPFTSTGISDFSRRFFSGADRQ